MISSPRTKGVALVIILFVIVLVVGLIIAFLNMARTERSSAASFVASTEVRKLSETAVGIVQAQINLATSGTTGVAWASQPGLLRTFKTSGVFDTAYKLYAANTLTVTDPTQVANDLPPTDWASSPAVWTDLNSPVTTTSGTTYPILDPAALSSVQGFSITLAPGSTAKQLAPMPVRWMYVLKSGLVVAPQQPASGTSVTIAEASGTNPIIGRIAFWTDDDTCKVNLNTAGVGSGTTASSGYWDTPRFMNAEDRKFGTSQPVNGEFQRYPGHPAMTSLSVVFPGLSDQDILTKITPRYQWGGSLQGTLDTYAMTTALASGTLASKPLLSSVDEITFSFDPSSTLPRADNAQISSSLVQSAKFFLTAHSQAPEVNLFDLPRIACWPISTNPAGQTTFDKVIAFCSTINGQPYYFSRGNALDPVGDAAPGSRNMQLYGYLQNLTNAKIPGFGVNLKDKFDTDRDQILTEVWDYIRTTNLYDSRLNGHQYTADLGNNVAGNAAGFGYVVPLQVGATQGFGRAMTISELAFQFICTADPKDPANPTATYPTTKGLSNSNDPKFNRTLWPSGTTALPSQTVIDTWALTSDQKRVQMMILPEFFVTSLGNIPVTQTKTKITIKGLSSLTLAGQTLFGSDSYTFVLNGNFNNGITHARRDGGPLDYRAVLEGVTDYGQLDASVPTGTVNGISAYGRYPFISNFVTVPTTGGTMLFNGSTLTVTIETSKDGTSWNTEQTIPMTVPGSTAIPIPNLVTGSTTANTTSSIYTPATDDKHWWAFSFTSPWDGDTTGAGGRLQGDSGTPGNAGVWKVTGGVPNAADTDVASGSVIRAGNSSSTYCDVVRTLAPSHDDYRLVAASGTVPVAAFTPVGSWTAPGPAGALQHTLGTGSQAAGYMAGGSLLRKHFTGLSVSTPPDFRADAPSDVLSALSTNGDFDNGMSLWPDGAFINKPDEGTNYYTASSPTPYFIDSSISIDSTTFFSPNRITPGPGMFGSLPTHVMRYQADPNHPEKYAWRTLLFRNQPTHPNAVTWSNGLPSAAPDHLLMDLFWMPTVEPYAISEPFVTAGKINMNYEIQPFTYLNRKTGMYAVLANEKIAAVPNTKNGLYKAATIDSASYRSALDIPQTLSQFDARFTAAKTTGRIFLSPTELCDMWLVPIGQTASDSAMTSYWSGRALTGDNVRERPYANIIPRLTTKSNTYTVHFRVQTIKTTKTNTWDEGKNTITGEYRGSTTIERFIDPNTAGIPDYAASPNPTSLNSLGSYYRWHVLENRQFAP